MTGSIARDIEKKAAGTYPMQDVFIRKAKVLRKPKFDRKCLRVIDAQWNYFSIWILISHSRFNALSGTIAGVPCRQQ